MSGRIAIRGHRPGSGPMGEIVRGEGEPRITKVFWCSLGHQTSLSFADSVDFPEQWDCSCGRPSGPVEDAAPVRMKPIPHKTHLQYVQDRRDPAAAAELLTVALDGLRAKNRQLALDVAALSA